MLKELHHALGHGRHGLLIRSSRAATRIIASAARTWQFWPGSWPQWRRALALESVKAIGAPRQAWRSPVPCLHAENGAGALHAREWRRRDFLLRKSRKIGMIPSCEPQNKRKRIDTVPDGDADFYPGWAARRKKMARGRA